LFLPLLNYKEFKILERAEKCKCMHSINKYVKGGNVGMKMEVRGKERA
jgi:hypothetical protein